MTFQATPVFTSSVYRHAVALQEDDGTIYFSLPERLPFEDRDDTIIHSASGTEYLWELAQRYYAQNRVNAFDMWEVIAQFQPEPIQDASLPVPKGQIVLIPSEDYIEDFLFGEPLSLVPVI